VPALDQALIGRALDLGAAGVVIPLVEDADGARAAVAATRYPPAGVRSFGPARPAGHPSRGEGPPLCLPMVETVAGLRAAAEIAAVAGVDGIFVGTMDLGLSLGLGVSAEPPAALREAVAAVVATCERQGVLAAGVARDAAEAADLLALGMRMLTIAADRGLLATGLRTSLAAVPAAPTR
jgi:4-hydroxy-2-oxoheptanedioate aldolase